MTTKTEWMLDVLDDLICFCAQNGMDGAAEKLDETRRGLAEELQRVEFKKDWKPMGRNRPLM